MLLEEALSPFSSPKEEKTSDEVTLLKDLNEISHNDLGNVAFNNLNIYFSIFVHSSIIYHMKENISDFTVYECKCQTTMIHVYFNVFCLF